MQDSEGKTSRKSDEIATTPTRVQTAEVTPRLNATEREQANPKNAKKKGLENYFGTGARVPPPSLAGTPTDAAGQRRGGGNKERNDRTPQRSEETGFPREVGETNQREDSAASKRRSKKSLTKGLDDEHSRRSKKTRSDDVASSPD